MPTAASAPTYGDLAWWTVFPDPDLQELIRTALAQNYDVRVAVSRILQAQSQVTIARSPIYPTVDGSVTGPYNAYTGSERPSPDSIFQPQAGFDIAWELDIWGRYRRGTEAAQAAAARQRGLPVRGHRDAGGRGRTCLSDPARPRPQPRDLQSHRGLQKAVARPGKRPAGGRRGRGPRRAAGRDAAATARPRRSPRSSARSSSKRTAINVLLGQNPGPIKRGRPLEQQIAAPALPPGLPTELLTRRPDIRAAEQQLVAANAQIGVAKSLLYPQVTISGFAGGGSSTISGSTFGPYGVFSALPAITLPIFNAGRLRANVDYNEALAQEAALRYQQTLQQALREVSDALIDVRKRQEFREQQQLLVSALADASEVANMRYEGGVSSYLEVLDTERQLFDAERDLVLARRDESRQRGPALQGTRRRMAGRLPRGGRRTGTRSRGGRRAVRTT